MCNIAIQRSYIDVYATYTCAIVDRKIRILNVNDSVTDINLSLASAPEELAANAYDNEEGRLKVAQIYNQVCSFLLSSSLLRCSMIFLWDLYQWWQFYVSQIVVEFFSYLSGRVSSSTILFSDRLNCIPPRNWCNSANQAAPGYCVV